MGQETRPTGRPARSRSTGPLDRTTGGPRQSGTTGSPSPAFAGAACEFHFAGCPGSVVGQNCLKFMTGTALGPDPTAKPSMSRRPAAGDGDPPTMSRTRLVGAALLFISVLPGCGVLTGDHRTFCERWRDCRHGNRFDACPAGYPVVDGGSAMPIPGGFPNGGAPIMMGGPPGVPFGAETLPQPGTVNPMPPRIPKIGIDEGGKGKQFELEGASRTGGHPGPALPVNGTK